MAAFLRVELFPAEIGPAVAFYESLGFAVRKQDEDYAFLGRDGVRVGLVRAGSLAADAVDPDRRAVPSGTELLLEVDDVRAERDRAVAAGLSLEADLTERPWGLTDFRLRDPDGYYWRLTSR